MNIRRGLLATALSAIVGALIPASVAAAYAVFRWLNPAFVPSNRMHDFLGELLEYWTYPVCGVAVFFGCAAWASFAPAGTWRFVPSLLVVFTVSFACWFVVGFLDNWLDLGWFRIYKGEDPNALRLSQALVLFGPPPAIAQVLALMRQWRVSRLQGAPNQKLQQTGPS